MIDETPNDEQGPEETPAEETPVADTPAETPETPAEPEAQDETPAEPVAQQGDPTPDPVETGSAPQPADEPVAAEAPADASAEDETDEDAEVDETPRVKPAIPGMDLEVDIVLDGEGSPSDPYAEDGDETSASSDDDEDVIDDQPIAATIVLAEGARYSATGKRKTAVARVILKPGTGAYIINGRTLNEFFPRDTLQRNIRQPLEAVGFDTRMDVVARMHGGGVSSQAGALRHGISKALLEADPNLRGELKRRGFLTRDARVKERKKAGLKKARKRPQFSKR
jgi:small subunit ribosomal protein S9